MRRFRVLTLVLSVLIALIVLPCRDAQGMNVTLEEGHLRLDGEVLAPLSLQGNWLYIPDRLVPAADIEEAWSSGVMRPVPAVAGTPEVLGYSRLGTLALKLERPFEDSSYWAIHEVVGYTSLEAFWVQRDAGGRWQSRSALRIGRPSDPPEQTLSRLASGLATFDWTGKEGYLVFHVSNPHGPSALFSPPQFGPLAMIQKAEFRKRMESCLALGMFLMIFIFNIGLFLQRREDKESFWLAACVLSLALRFMGTEFLFMYGIETPPSWLLKVQTMAQVNMTAFAMGFYASFLGAAYPGYVRKGYLQAYWVACLLYLYFQMFLTEVGSPATWIYFLVPQFLFAFYIVKETLRAAYNRLIGSGYIALGLAVLVLGLVNDFLIFTQAFRSFYLAHYAMIFWTMALTMSIGKQFAKAFRTARRLSRTLKDEVEQQTRNIRSVLTNLRQGLFTFDAKFQVMPEYSRYTETILKEEALADKPALELLFDGSNINEEAVSIVKSSLVSSLSEDEVVFELNQANLPRELVKGDGELRTFIELDWAPMLNEKGETQRILVTMRDVTEVRRLKSINDQNKENLELMYRILSIDEQSFGDFIVNSKALLNECQGIAHQLSDVHQDAIKVIFINLHTIKGNARSYQLEQMTLLLHKLEQHCADWLNNKRDLLTPALLQEKLEEILGLIQRFEFINTKLLKRHIQGEKIQIDRQDVFAELAALERIQTRRLDPVSLENYTFVRKKLLDLVSYDPMILMEEVRHHTERVAQDLGLEPPILDLALVDVRLMQKTQAVLRHVFVHLVRNALDHGIERPVDRIRARKNVRGVVRVHWEKLYDQLLLRIEDDGRGLALQKLHKQAVEKGQLQPSERNPQTIASLIFTEGVSTAEQLTDISGRGIGMASIKRFLEDHGASIQIVFDQAWQGEPYLPFRFEIKLPPEAFIDMTLEPVPRTSSAM